MNPGGQIQVPVLLALYYTASALLVSGHYLTRDPFPVVSVPVPLPARKLPSPSSLL